MLPAYENVGKYVLAGVGFEFTQPNSTVWEEVHLNDSRLRNVVLTNELLGLGTQDLRAVDVDQEELVLDLVI